ncbi:MAG: carbohydrate kinase [Planctomycetota bacterium]|jgi:L-xylulokinase|nr:carbohydrate kinase [Planctomycetota bacterium]
MPKRYFLGLDNGGTMTKAAILDLEKKAIAAIAARKTEMLLPAPEWTEKNFEDIWQANVGMIRKVLADSGVSAGDIGGAAITGHGNGLYLSDADCRQTRNGIVSTDTRANPYADRCRRDGSFAKNHPLTLSSIWGGQPPMLLLWLKDHEPGTLARTRHIFLLKDMLRFRMTGEAFSEKTELSGGHLFNNRDDLFDDRVLANYGILDLKDKIPPVRNSHDCCGRITREVAEATGLAPGTPVYGGIFDTNACCIASGVVDSSMASIIGGTWSINQFLSREPVSDPGLFMDLRSCIPDRHLILECSPTGASNLEWFVNSILTDAGELCGKRGESIFQYCDRMLAASSPEAGVIFVPYLFSSHSMGQGAACFLGLKSFHNLANLIRAVYEGVCFSHRYHLENLRNFGDRSVRVRIAGGAAKSRAWLQMFADVIGRPMETTHGEELGILGTTMSALVGSGAFAGYEEAVGALVRVKDRADPNPALRDVYDEKFARYKAVVEGKSGLI